MPKSAPKVRLSASDKAEIDAAFKTIETVLARKNVNIAKVIGLISADEVASAKKQVTIKFAEETTAQMNMIAFD